MYKVIKFFTDLHDGEHPYDVGDSFPREGVTVTDARIDELSGSNNRQGTPLIKKEEKTEEKTEEKSKKPVKKNF